MVVTWWLHDGYERDLQLGADRRGRHAFRERHRSLRHRAPQHVRSQVAAGVAAQPLEAHASRADGLREGAKRLVP